MILGRYNEVCVSCIQPPLSIFLMGVSVHSWRRMRRAGQEALNKARVLEFHLVQSKEAVRTVEGILHNLSAGRVNSIGELSYTTSALKRSPRYSSKSCGINSPLRNVRPSRRFIHTRSYRPQDQQVHRHTDRLRLSRTLSRRVLPLDETHPLVNGRVEKESRARVFRVFRRVWGDVPPGRGSHRM